MALHRTGETAAKCLRGELQPPSTYARLIASEMQQDGTLGLTEGSAPRCITDAIRAQMAKGFSPSLDETGGSGHCRIGHDLHDNAFNLLGAILVPLENLRQRHWFFNGGIPRKPNCDEKSERTVDLAYHAILQVESHSRIGIPIVVVANCESEVIIRKFFEKRIQRVYGVNTVRNHI